MNLLDRIVAEKEKEVGGARARRPLALLEREIENAPPVRELFSGKGGDFPLVIAEMKSKSPSRGVIRDPYDPVDLATRYRDSGAAGLSILTDTPFFGGSLDDLGTVRRSAAGAALPVLRKDFIIDPYQVYQSRCAGADLVLLIVRILPGSLLESLLDLARALGMRALVETHEEEEVSRALDCGADLVGINHRDLDRLTIDLDRGERLAAMIPPHVRKVAESGLKTFGDYGRMRSLGFDAVLVGESFLASPDPGHALRVFRGALD